MSPALKLARIQRIFNYWWGLIQNFTPGVAHGEFLPELDRASQCHGTRVVKCLPNISHIHDQEGKTWEMEPAIAALQRELVRLEKAE